MSKDGGNVDTDYTALLKSFAKANPAIVVPSDNKGKEEIVAYIIANAPEGSRKKWVTDVLAIASASSKSKDYGWGSIALVFAGGIIAAILVYGVFFSQNFLQLLADNNYARGLITFLFAFGTIAIIVVISIAVFWARMDEVERRVGIAKDILTLLIGIFGTILGFYFGSTNESVQRPNPPTAQNTTSQ